jgi:hypothetical protein
VTAFTAQEIRTAWAQAATLVPLPGDMFTEELVAAVRSVPELAADDASVNMRVRFMAHLVINRLTSEPRVRRVIVDNETFPLPAVLRPIPVAGQRGLHADLIIIDDEMTPDEGSESDDTEGHQRG